MPKAVARTRDARALSPVVLDLLRMSAGTTDIADFRTHVNAVCTRYTDDAIRRQLDQLILDGLLRMNGSPRVGWLTEKGKALLARAH